MSKKIKELELESYRQVENEFWSAICEDTTHINVGTRCFSTELTLPLFNFIYLEQGATVESLIDAKALFAFKKKQHTLVVSESIIPSFSAQITQLGYEKEDLTTAMGLNLNNFKITKPARDNFNIKLTNDDLDLWAEPLISAFPVAEDDDNSVIIEYKRYHQRALDKNTKMYHLTLLVNEMPISTLTLTLFKDQARIDDMGTNNQYQGQGYATELLNYALDLCKQKSIKFCYLEASSDGLSVYTKLGFQPLFNYHIFMANSD